MSKLTLVLGIILGIVAVVLVNWHIAQIEGDTKAAPFLTLSPDYNLVKGDVIQEEMLVTESLPSKFSSLGRLALPDSSDSRAWIVGREVTRDVQAGSLLLHEYFLDDPQKRFAAQIEKGKRALTLNANSTTAVAYFIQPGSRVDVLGTFIRQVIPGEEETQISGFLSEITETKVVLQNVKVLAVDQATTRGKYLEVSGEGFSTVTVEVSPVEAELLIFAQNQARGALSFVLRNPTDDKVAEIPSVSWDSIE